MVMTEEEVAAYLKWRKANPREAAIQDELNQYRMASESEKITGIQEITSRIAVLASQARCLHCSSGSGAVKLREEAEVLAAAAAVRDRLFDILPALKDGDSQPSRAKVPVSLTVASQRYARAGLTPSPQA